MPSELLFFIRGIKLPKSPASLQEAEEWSNRIQDTTETIEVGSQTEKEFAIMQQRLGWRFGPTPNEAANTAAITSQRYNSYRQHSIFDITR